MKILKRLSLGTLLLILLLTLISFFLPREINMQKKILIHGSAKDLFTLVNTPSMWKKWSVWDQMGADVKDTYEGPESGKGAVHICESEQPDVGSGRMMITESVPDKSVTIRFLFMKHGSANATWTFTPTPGGTVVSSSFYTVLPPLIGPYIRLMMLKEIEEHTMKSMENLKHIAENQEAQPALQLAKTSIDRPVPYLSITDSFPLDQVDSALASMFGELGLFMHAQGMRQTGAPIGIWHTWDEQRGKASFTAGIPVHPVRFDAGRIVLDSIPSGKVVTANHFGSYETLHNTYAAMEAYCSEHQIETLGAPWEVYMTDPQMEPDTAKWQTAVFYRIK